MDVFSNIYVFTNKINGKKYVGQTINVNERYKQHFKDAKHDNLLFHNALEKYVEEGFLFEVIEEDIPLDIVSEREKYWISELNSKKPNGYNLTDGGEGTFGYKHTEESKKKMSSTKKGVFTHFQSEETRKKISEANKGNKPSEYCVQRVKEAKTGVPLSDETKKKISIATKGVPKTPEHIEKVKQSLANKSEEEKKLVYEKVVNTKREKGIVFGQHFLDMNEEEKKNMYNKISKNNKRCRSVKGVNLTDGSEIEFHSLGKAGEWIHEKLGFSKNAKVTIRDSIKSNGTAYGYKWEYI
jgi:group I intron endonuclease